MEEEREDVSLVYNVAHILGNVVALVVILELQPTAVKAHRKMEYSVLSKRFWSNSVVAFEML